MPTAKEVHSHYDGEAQVTFYPGNHSYFVDDEGFEFRGKRYSYKRQRAGGATSVTGVMDKGKGLMMWPMWEMNKYIKHLMETTSVKDLIDSDLTLNDLLKNGRDAHRKKSDLGKSVGSDAHDYVERYFRALQESQENGTKFTPPKVPSAYDLNKTLRASYIRIINDLKPKTAEDYKQLPKLIETDIEMQEAIWVESDMIRKSILAFREWVDLHDIRVIGAEQNTYSRTAASKYLQKPVPQCGYYDAILEITCSAKCGHCYTNGVGEPVEDTFTGIYITDFKTTNTSSEFKLGIYPEYLPQCGVYDLGTTEEFPDLDVSGHLILNGSKKDGSFATYFSFDRERNMDWACHLVAVKESLYTARKDIKKIGDEHAKELQQQIKKAKATVPSGAAAN